MLLGLVRVVPELARRTARLEPRITSPARTRRAPAACEPAAGDPPLVLVVPREARASASRGAPAVRVAEAREDAARRRAPERLDQLLRRRPSATASRISARSPPKRMTPPCGSKLEQLAQVEVVEASSPI